MPSIASTFSTCNWHGTIFVAMRSVFADRIGDFSADHYYVETIFWSQRTGIVLQVDRKVI